MFSPLSPSRDVKLAVAIGFIGNEIAVDKDHVSALSDLDAAGDIINAAELSGIDCSLFQNLDIVPADENVTALISMAKMGLNLLD